MVVHQSKTEPQVRVRQVANVFSHAEVEQMSKRVLIGMMRRQYGIPRRVLPDRIPTEYGWEFRFRWFEVETD
ncbi:hypothetical protein SEA_A3WALLY_276 [Microbacterium phage A3Wally]|nr:hypothetical protein SEA_A3WALLY_276 [Microbacterium phage A3Wally]